MPYLSIKIKFAVMKITLIIFSCLLFMFSCSFKLNKADQLSRKQTEIVLNNKLIKNSVEGYDHIVFSVADENYIILINDEKSVHEFYIQLLKNEEILIISDSIVQISEELTNIMFNKSAYKEKFISFNSDFYKSGFEVSSGKIIYFVFKGKNKKKYGESRLSFFVKPNPINSLVYSYFVTRFYEYVQSN